ncbi:diguanylate cyclase (GGDEF) domain-containing protein [Pseudomonas cuatrocienegasensis]|uniref:diguanylate cyclase n=1 Tax=Pseudomonas cuatrocienegasensis TaxID=543360 RepID=A0ABY1BIZ1_9PSED|nr:MULTISPECIES: GGDEF domain-containing protein [Pseudomonas]OEC34595.1 diguanylate cyclase [Pseudomonas sp. 21C1]SEQ97123.1 diguanylate cyclase (GGDEF) domain-containing protein [Pseudomonas cuatrocienegasensis]
MPPLLKFHAWKLAGLLLLANLGLLAHLIAGNIKPTSEWDWTDIFGEGGSTLLVLLWIGLLLKSRPAGRVTSLLFCGLACLFFSLWMDSIDEFVQLPAGVNWDKWLESGPMPVGFILVTLGIYHWHREQLAISAQMEKRERLFREHRLFDKLTPLGAADYLRLQVQQALQQSRAEGQPLSLVILDLNDFDRLNREHGHAEGDSVLQSLTQLLLLNLRRQDLLCRLAGDRFVALLPSTGAQQAQQIASELQDAVRHLAYRSQRNGERLHLVAAVASVLAQDEDGDSLLKRLNLALARAKQTPAAKRA